MDAPAPVMTSRRSARATNSASASTSAAVGGPQSGTVGRRRGDVAGLGFLETGPISTDAEATTRPRAKRGAADIAPAREASRIERTAKTRRGRFRRGRVALGAERSDPSYERKSVSLGAEWRSRRMVCRRSCCLKALSVLTARGLVPTAGARAG